MADARPGASPLSLLNGLLGAETSKIMAARKKETQSVSQPAQRVATAKAKPEVLVAPDVPVETPVKEEFKLSPEEMQAILKLREARTESILTSEGGGDRNQAITDIAKAFADAINATKAPEKKTPFNRKKGDPWQPKPGQIKPKLKRTMYLHGLEFNPAQLFVEEVELLNQVKPGSYCGGHIQVIKRKDRSYDIDYPIRTASQRLKLVNQFQITSLRSLLQRIVDEANNPALYKGPDDDND